MLQAWESHSAPLGTDANLEKDRNGVSPQGKDAGGGFGIGGSAFGGVGLCGLGQHGSVAIAEMGEIGTKVEGGCPLQIGWESLLRAASRRLLMAISAWLTGISGLSMAISRLLVSIAGLQVSIARLSAAISAL